MNSYIIIRELNQRKQKVGWHQRGIDCCVARRPNGGPSIKPVQIEISFFDILFFVWNLFLNSKSVLIYRYERFWFIFSTSCCDPQKLFWIKVHWQRPSGSELEWKICNFFFFCQMSKLLDKARACIQNDAGTHISKL